MVQDITQFFSVALIFTFMFLHEISALYIISDTGGLIIRSNAQRVYRERQIGAPSIASGIKRLPCTCEAGICGCCTGSFIHAFKSKGCMNITYNPEDFSFDFKMLINNQVLYTNRVSGRNPPPICVTIPRIGIAEACATFSDVFFVGRNMHLCLDIGIFYQGYEILSRSFECLRMGDQGILAVKPGEIKPQTNAQNIQIVGEAEIDAGTDDLGEYDENIH